MCSNWQSAGTKLDNIIRTKRAFFVTSFFHIPGRPPHMQQLAERWHKAGQYHLRKMSSLSYCMACFFHIPGRPLHLQQLAERWYQAGQYYLCKMSSPSIFMACSFHIPGRPLHMQQLAERWYQAGQYHLCKISSYSSFWPVFFTPQADCTMYSNWQSTGTKLDSIICAKSAHILLFGLFFSHPRRTAPCTATGRASAWLGASKPLARQAP